MTAMHESAIRPIPNNLELVMGSITSERVTLYHA